MSGEQPTPPRLRDYVDSIRGKVSDVEMEALGFFMQRTHDLIELHQQLEESHESLSVEHQKVHVALRRVSALLAGAVEQYGQDDKLNLYERSIPDDDMQASISISKAPINISKENAEADIVTVEMTYHGRREQPSRIITSAN